MRKHFLPILLVLLKILLAGCSKPSELPQNTEIISSSVTSFHIHNLSRSFLIHSCRI